MKKRYLFLILAFFILVILILNNRDKGLNKSYEWPTPVPLHEIQEIGRLQVEWQLQNVHSSVDTTGPFIMAQNGKVAFLGSLDGKDTYQAIILNASDGKQVAEIGPIGYSTQFILDDSALYFGKPDVITKIDVQTGFI